MISMIAFEIHVRTMNPTSDDCDAEPDDDCNAHSIVRNPRTHNESKDVQNPRTHDESENKIDHRSNKERWKDINNNNVNNESNIDNNTSKVFVDDDGLEEIVAGNDDGFVQIVAGSDDDEYDMTVGKYELVKSKLIGNQRTNGSNVDDNTFTQWNESMKINARCKIHGRSCL